MLSPLQLNTSVYRPNRAARGSVPIRFGRQEPTPNPDPLSDLLPNFPTVQPNTFDPQLLKPLNTAIKGLHDFGPSKKDPYYGYDFAKQYGNLTPRAQAQVRKIYAQLTARDLETMKKENTLGVVEEASDMLFEAYTLKALRKGLFTNAKVDAWKKKYLPAATDAARQEKPYDGFIKELDKELPNEKVKSLTQSMPWDPRKARTLYDLMASKFVTMRSRDSQFDLWKKTKPLLMAEDEELRDAFPRFSPRRLQIWLLGAAYTYIPGLPMSFLVSQLKNIASSRLHADVRYNDLMENVFAKQFRRQEHDYQTQDAAKGLDNEARRKKLKQTLKGIEVIDETLRVKNIFLRHSLELPSF